MANNKLTSIIILGYNQLGYTKLCIESIYRYTISPFELILVDNGSTDGTAEYVESIVGAKVIKNKENLGFAKGCNQGIEAAEGDYILFLNNDVIVTEHWLDNMIECLESDPKIGIVGPRSNYVNSAQIIDVSYDTIEGLHRFAGDFNRQGQDKWFEVDLLIGFCMLIKREVIDKVGLLDERFGLGNFEDNDFCLRTRTAGYRLVCAGNTYIHHFGNRTFAGNQVPYGEWLEENLKKFNEKWGKQTEESHKKGGKEETAVQAADPDIADILTSIQEALFTKAKLASSWFEARRGKLSKRFHQGLTYYIDGDYGKALKIFEDLSPEASSFGYVQYALALTLMMMGRFKDAKRILAYELSKRDNDINMLLAYGDCLVALGELSSAKAYYDKALEIRPSSISARMGLVVVERVEMQPERLKFIKNLEALVNFKIQLAVENNERLCVTYLTINHGIAGGSKVNFEHINRLIERGHNVHAVSHWQQPEWFDLHTKVITVPLGKELSDYVPPESDVVVATFWSQMHDLLKAKGTAHVYFVQGDKYLFEKDKEKRTDNYQPVIQKLADANHYLPAPLFVVSEGLKGLLRSYYDRESTVIPGAIDLDVFKPGQRRKKKKPKLLMVGSDDLEFKGLHFISEAFQRIKRTRDVEVVWVSPKPKTSSHIKCDTFVQAPSQLELAKIYADCDVFVSASTYDAFPLPPLEAMACGTPAVVTINEGTKSYIENGVNCLTVPIRDSGAIFNAVNRILDNDLLRERIIKGGLATAAKYNWRRTIDILEEKLWNLAMFPKVPFVDVLPEEVKEEEAGQIEAEGTPGAIATSDYYNFPRTDVLELVPADAKRILDVGCAAGVLGKALKERGATEVVGVEVVKEVANEAKKYLDRVIVGDIEHIELDYPEGYFDCIVLADVLEHLYNPWQALAKLKRLLSDAGKVVCSIPNIGHAFVLRNLLNGTWKYEEAGILDITHLRFFTLESAFALLMSAGFEIDGVIDKVVCGPDEEDFIAKLQSSGLANDACLKHASAYQFLLTATPLNSNARPSGTADLDVEIGVGSMAEEPSIKPKLSLAMIVKNEADNLGRCLKSVEDVVDEIIVVDTGSTDDTVAIAENFGAKVIRYPWQNDFSAARNVSLDHSTGEWVMFLDADEELVKEDIPELKELLQSTQQEGFFFNEFSFVGEKEDDGGVVNPAFRLWRNKPEYRFTGALHEQIVAKVQSHNPNVGFSGVRIKHYGYLNKVTTGKDKIKRNLDILLKEVKDKPNDSFTRFNLGVEYLRLSDYDKALEQYKAAFANLSSLSAAYASVLIRNIALCLKELGRREEALKVLRDAKEAYPDYTDLFYLEGLVYLEDKDPLTAIKCFKTCLDMGPSGKTHISQSGVGGHLAAYALGRAYRLVGDEVEAVVSFKKSLIYNSRDCSSLSELGLMLVRRESPGDLKRFLESLADLSSEDVLFTLSSIFSQGRYYEISLEYLNKLSSNNSNPARAALLTGEALLNLNRYQEAVVHLLKVPKSSQFFRVASLDRAICHLLLAQREDAVAALDVTKNDEGFHLIHVIYKAVVDLVDGKKSRLFIKDEQKKQAYRVIADILGKFLELQEFEVFEKAIAVLGQLNLSAGERSLFLGKVYYDAGYNELAVEELIRAYESGSADAEAFFILGRTALNNEFYEEAKTFFLEALNGGIEEPTLYISLGRTFIKLGEIERAVDILDMGARKYPDSPFINDIRQSISALV